MRPALEFCIFGIALFIAVVAGFYLAVALGFGESIWEPLAAMASAFGIMGLMGLLRTDADLAQGLNEGPINSVQQVE